MNSAKETMEIRQMDSGAWAIAHRSNDSIISTAPTKEECENLLNAWDAAPDLLEALSRMMHNEEMTKEDYSFCEKALTKAKGEV